MVFPLVRQIVAGTAAAVAATALVLILVGMNAHFAGARWLETSAATIALGAIGYTAVRAIAPFPGLLAAEALPARADRAPEARAAPATS